MKRSLKTSGHTSADCSAVRSDGCPAASKSALGRALTSGRRLRATQPVRPWPLRIVSCWITFGFDAGREAAAQRLVLLVVEEQRAARERHDVAQLRRDERHRVRHAEAAAHRLRDFVQRVDFAVRERDVLEHVGACRPCEIRRPGRRRAAAVGACVGTRVSLRAGSWLASASAASAGYMSMNVCTTRGSSALPLSWRSRPIAASKLIAL